MSKTFSELCDIQRDFDKKHSVAGNSFYVDINEDNLKDLEHLIVCLLGELGEFSNLVKKVVRGDAPLNEMKSEIDEEFADTFIYLIKIANQFNIDLETEFLKKMSKNRSRFKEG